MVISEALRDWRVGESGVLRCVRKRLEADVSGMRANSEASLRASFIEFSDSFVGSGPLRNDDGDLARMVIVFSARSIAAVVMLAAFAGKHPLRGGIDVGLARDRSRRYLRHGAGPRTFCNRAAFIQITDIF